MLLPGTQLGYSLFLPFGFPPTSFLCRATLLFSKTFLIRSLRGWEGQAESHSLVPLAPPCPENQSCEEPQWAARTAQVWGWDLEIAWGLLGFQLSTTRLRLAKLAQDKLDSLWASVSLPSMKRKENYFILLVQCCWTWSFVIVVVLGDVQNRRSHCL